MKGTNSDYDDLNAHCGMLLEIQAMFKMLARFKILQMYEEGWETLYESHRTPFWLHEIKVELFPRTIRIVTV